LVPPVDSRLAERVLGQAIVYLITSMEKTGQGLEIGPGPIVDVGAHTFILDSRNYREFCAQNFDGGFLDHVPAVKFKVDGTVEKTAQVIAANGFDVDWSLWTVAFAKCSPCHPGNDGP
jgi:hypothetical protein